MVMRGVIYMSAGSSLFLWEPVCLPKIYISSHPLNWSTAYEREGACTHHLHVCGLVLSGFVFLRQCSPINVRPYQPCQCGIHFISLLSSLIKYPPPHFSFLFGWKLDTINNRSFFNLIFSQFDAEQFMSTSVDTVLSLLSVLHSVELLLTCFSHLSGVINF